jgi:hypothetical protein
MGSNVSPWPASGAVSIDMDLDHPQRLSNCGERSRAAHLGFFPKKLEEFLDQE